MWRTKKYKQLLKGILKEIKTATIQRQQDIYIKKEKKEKIALRKAKEKLLIQLEETHQNEMQQLKEVHANNMNASQQLQSDILQDHAHQLDIQQQQHTVSKATDLEEFETIKHQEMTELVETHDNVSI